MGRRNSSRRISPGWIAKGLAMETSVVIDDLYRVGVGVAPDEADAVLVVDADGVPAFSVLDERLQAVVGRDAQVLQRYRCVEHCQLPGGNPAEIGGNATTPSRPPEQLGVGVA